jgi:hypothetical protein
MEATYNRLGQPGIFRNDRFWLAGDHVVDPRVKDVPQVKALVDASERAKRVFKMTEYQGMNVRFLLSNTCSSLCVDNGSMGPVHHPSH